jgi:hypothetical protein
MTSVGYGDLFCKSYHGRLIAGFATMWGTVFLTLIVNSLTNTLKP